MAARKTPEKRPTIKKITKTELIKILNAKFNSRNLMINSVKIGSTEYVGTSLKEIKVTYIKK